MASEYLRALPELNDPGTTVTLTPASYATWAACFAANPTKDTFLCTAGNYTGWGLMTIAAAQGHGTSSRRRVVRYIDQHTPPWRRVGTEALITGFSLGSSSPSPAHYWILHGLTMRDAGAATENNIWYASHDCIVARCLIEGSENTYGIRIRLGAIDNTVQECVIREAVSGDSIGVQIRVNAPDVTTGNRVVDCEIYNYGDSVQVTADDVSPELGVDGTIIDNNDFYTTNAYYSDGSGNLTTTGGYGVTENALDIKAGAEDSADPVIVTNNRMWGYRTSDTNLGATGSDGVAVVFHLHARNIRFWENVVFDCAGGLRSVVWVDPNPQVSRNIDIRRNVIQGCRQFIPADNGYALNMRITETMVSNVFAACTTLAHQDVASGQSAHTMRGNITRDTPLGSYSTYWSAGGDNEAREASEMKALAVVRKRLTGPETIHLAGCVRTEPLGGMGWTMRPVHSRRRR